MSRFSMSRMAEGVGMALGSVRANKVRAGLTILGVAIGVMVVIAMASAITGINRSVASILESAGPKTFFVFRYFQAGLNVSDGSEELSPWRKMPAITVAEARAVSQLPTVQDVTVEEKSSGAVQYGREILESASVRGYGASWVLVTGGSVVQGRTFTAAEEAGGAYVAVINEPVAERLFPGLDPIGKRIKVLGQSFTVIGLHAEAASLFGDGDEPRVAIPHTTFTKVADYQRGWMQLSVRPKEAATVQEAIEEVTATLRLRRGLKPSQDNNFSMVTQDKFLESFNSVTTGFFLVMLALSSVGLMVGGVGVVAIMMISVTERTREIGIRKALGATQQEILFQFLVEAATLTLIGGVVGMLLGGGIAWGINAFTSIPAAIPLWSVVTALVASVVTGVFFGIYPARKAARLDPVEALRYE